MLFSDEPRFADIDALNVSTSSASELSDRRANFRDRIIDRDGTCVCTGEEAIFCDASHIVPQCKGSNVRF
jgi:hypothetical protein